MTNVPKKIGKWEFYEEDFGKVYIQPLRYPHIMVELDREEILSHFKPSIISIDGGWNGWDGVDQYTALETPEERWMEQRHDMIDQVLSEVTQVWLNDDCEVIKIVEPCLV